MNYLERLAMKATGAVYDVQPRVRSRFESAGMVAETEDVGFESKRWRRSSRKIGRRGFRPHTRTGRPHVKRRPFWRTNKKRGQRLALTRT